MKNKFTANSDFNPLAYYEQMKQDEIIMAYNGAVSQGILVDLAFTLQSKSSETSEVTKKRIFSIFVELAQNILLHSEEKTFSAMESKEIGNGLILVKKTHDSFVIISGNKASKVMAERIRVKCEFINAMDKEELRKYYKEERQKPHEQGKSGGNIGLIEMIKKSGNPIKIELTEIDKEYSFMSLYVTIKQFI